MAEQAGLESEVLSASSGLSNCKAPNLIPEERQVAGGLAPCVEEWTQRHEGELPCGPRWLLKLQLSAKKRTRRLQLLF